MSVKAIAWAFSCKTGSPASKMVLVKLADNANDDGYCFPSVAYLADHCELNRATVIRHIKNLAELGFVTIIPQRRQGVSLPNHYQLHLIGVVAQCDGGVVAGCDGGSRTVRPLLDLNRQREPSEEQPLEVVSAAPKRPPVPVKEIVDLYHQVLPACPQVKKLTNTRRAQIEARWRNGDLPDLNTWRSYLEFCSESKFLTGKTDPGPGRQRFVADLEWLSREGNYAKVYEGRYHK